MNDTNQLALGDVLRDEAIDRVGLHNEAFCEMAKAAISACAVVGGPFTSDDVWALIPFATHTDPRALGAAFRNKQLDGLIRPTGRYVKSTRAACHSRRICEWEGVRK